jgi:hypothetical protein
MVPLTLFRSRAFLGANIFTLLLYATLGIFFFLFPIALIQQEGYSPTAAGSAMLPTILVLFFLSRWSGGLVKRFGGKIPLIVGPLAVAAGFLLFAAAAGGGSYWRTYLPASLVLGLGMAITVAPLTTVVMGSVDSNHAGAASGINNAVARVAGVLAIAIFGIVMVRVFGTNLDRDLATLPLPAEAVGELRSKEIELAGMELPRDLETDARTELRTAISEAFLSGFRVVLLCCSGLSIGSAFTAWRLVPKK